MKPPKVKLKEGDVCLVNGTDQILLIPEKSDLFKNCSGGITGEWKYEGKKYFSLRLIPNQKLTKIGEI